jgi:hypothetical protein
MTDVTAARNKSAPVRRQIGPYSRELRRGAIGASLDGRSTDGRFIRDLEAQLTAHVGGSPNIAQRLLIERIVRTAVQLRLLDGKLEAGTWTDLDCRTHGGLVNRQRLLLREIGLEPAIKTGRRRRGVFGVEELLTDGAAA